MDKVYLILQLVSDDEENQHAEVLAASLDESEIKRRFHLILQGWESEVKKLRALRIICAGCPYNKRPSEERSFETPVPEKCSGKDLCYSGSGKGLRVVCMTPYTSRCIAEMYEDHIKWTKEVGDAVYTGPQSIIGMWIQEVNLI